MDLSEEWGKANVEFGKPREEYISWAAVKNTKIIPALPTKYKEDRFTLESGGYTGFEVNSEPVDFKEVFVELVRNKPRRIGLEFPQGLMVTRYRSSSDGDPRLRPRYHV